MLLKFRSISIADWPEIKSIYESGISTGFATFQTSAPTWEAWNESHVASCRILALHENSICGWAALSPVSKRTVYRGVAEVSLYIAENARGKGVGLALINELIKQSESNGFWTLQSSIFPQNVASIKLHEKAGFRMVGTLEKIGQLNDVWFDNLIYERRSKHLQFS